MALTSAQILNFLISYKASFQGVDPLMPTLAPKIAVNFDGITNMGPPITGSFMPANNSKVIANNFASVAPNFVFLEVDGPVIFSSDNNMFSNLAVNKILYVTLPTIVGGGNPWNSFTLDGRTSLPYPMPQGVEVNYTLIYGQATIT